MSSSKLDSRVTVIVNVVGCPTCTCVGVLMLTKYPGSLLPVIVKVTVAEVKPLLEAVNVEEPVDKSLYHMFEEVLCPAAIVIGLVIS